MTLTIRGLIRSDNQYPGYCPIYSWHTSTTVWEANKMHGALHGSGAASRTDPLHFSHLPSTRPKPAIISRMRIFIIGAKANQLGTALTRCLNTHIDVTRFAGTGYDRSGGGFGHNRYRSARSPDQRRRLPNVDGCAQNLFRNSPTASTASARKIWRWRAPNTTSRSSTSAPTKSFPAQSGRLR